MVAHWNAFDWEAICEEAVTDLQQLLQIDSSNPPGNESRAAAFVAGRLREDGLEPVVLESAPNRPNVITRIEGSEDLAPLLLSAHLDVVPAGDGWKYPPFSGAREEGFVWGRGAIDMKNMAVMCMWMMKLLKRLDTPPKRTVIFAAVADEEAGCHMGSHWLVDNHPELLNAGYMISELGGFTLHLMGKRFYPIQVAEKGQVEILMRTRGEKGHGSIPRADTANTLLAEAIAKLGTRSLPRHLTPVQTRFVREVSKHISFPLSRVFPLLLSPAGDRLLGLLPKAQSEPLSANFRNTVSVTVIEAGGKGQRNVIPGEACAWLDGRTLPGQTPEDLIREIREIIGPIPELEILDAQPPVWLDDYNDELFGMMCQSIKKYDPQGIPIPYMVPGFTDAKAYHRLGMRCYGFAPVKLPEDISFATLFHGLNERIPVDGFKWGMRTFADVIGQFSGIS